MAIFASFRRQRIVLDSRVLWRSSPARFENEWNYKGEVNYNEEDDQHFPTLTVEQTLEFSLLNKTKKHEKGDIPIIIGALLKMFGISHTRHTLVGDVSVLFSSDLRQMLTDKSRHSSEEFQEANESVCLSLKHLRRNPQSWLGTIVPEAWMLRQLSTTLSHFEL